jgi:alpha-D-xyloside xylohydrolase
LLIYKDNYSYEKGIFLTITFNWNDKANTLTIADRKGTFSGILKTRTFKIVVFDAKNETGDKVSASFSKTISYNGKLKSVKF